MGIGGGSASGKTTLARWILDRLPPGTGVRIPADAYYLDLSHLPVAERGHRNFDHPEALDADLLLAHVEALEGGSPVRLPAYDFGSHTRSDAGDWVSPAPVILVEGVLVLAMQPLRDRIDLAIFVETDEEERLARRLRRDVHERGRTRSSVLQQWRETVGPMHEQFVAPSRIDADVVVPGAGRDPASWNVLLARIQGMLGGGGG